MDIVLRGTSSAKIDDKGRLKLPNGFRTLVEAEYGSALFVTSVTGGFVRIYPLRVWIELERKIAGTPTTHPARMKFVDRVNYFGQLADLDKQGRVLIHARLRESAHMIGEVDVFGHYNFLEVWNHERFLAKLQREPYTDDDARALSDFGI